MKQLAGVSNIPKPKPAPSPRPRACGGFPDRSHLRKAFGGAPWGWEFRGSPLSRDNVLSSRAVLKPCGQRDGDSRTVSPSLCPRLEKSARARRGACGTFQLFLGLGVFFGVFSHPQQIPVPSAQPLSLKLWEARASTMPHGCTGWWHVAYDCSLVLLGPRSSAFCLLRPRST